LFGLIWTCGFIEYHQFYGNDMFVGFFAGIGDFIPLVTLGLLTGAAFGDSGQKRRETRRFVPGVFGLFIILLFFASGRYIFYESAGIQVKSMHVAGFFCEIALAASICIPFFYFRDFFISAGRGLQLKKELYFIYVFFGINWALFNLFPSIKYDFPILKIGYLVFIDLLMLTLGVFFYKLLFGQKEEMKS